MILPKSDTDHFFRLYHSILIYINNNHKILKGLHRPEDLFRFDPDDVMKIKNKLYNKPDQIESFVRENPARLTSNDLEIVSSWSNFLKDRFYIVRHLKNSTLFLSHESPPKAYAVLGLNSTLPDLVGSDLPILVDAVLLPYKDKIIYDGTLGSYKLSFGPGMRKSINDAFYQAKASYGIITSLPPPPVKAPTDSERLKGFLKSEYSRDVHYEEIKEIIQNNPELMSVFSQEMGRVHARAFRKRMKEMGLKEGWFAVMEGMIIAGGRTREEVEIILKTLLPEEKLKLVHIFKLKSV